MRSGTVLSVILLLMVTSTISAATADIAELVDDQATVATRLKPSRSSSTG